MKLEYDRLWQVFINQNQKNKHDWFWFVQTIQKYKKNWKSNTHLPYFQKTVPPPKPAQFKEKLFDSNDSADDMAKIADPLPVSATLPNILEFQIDTFRLAEI